MNTIRYVIKLIPRFLGILFVLVLFANCEDDKKEKAPTGPPVISTFYLIRHAEKDLTDPDDMNPELDQDGYGRSIRWAELFDPVALDAIYSTDFQRTKMTADPTSVKKNIDITFYQPSSLDVAEFITENKGKQVLVVGHSNTIPDLVNDLLGEQKYPQMDEDDYRSLFIVRMIDDKATDIHINMN
ncbi:MAG: phosphoglycerate mutase family protein [Bacteroidota bacterium]